MATDIAIIANKGYLAALGLKTLLHEIAPSLSVSLLWSEEEAGCMCAEDESVIFSFKVTEISKTVFVDMSLEEAQLKKQIRAAIKKLLATKEKDKKTTPTGNRQLSTREIDVLRLVASGFINKEIADKLSISLQTVLTHRKHISEKLGIRTTSGFTAYAMINKLV